MSEQEKIRKQIPKLEHGDTLVIVPSFGNPSWGQVYLMRPLPIGTFKRTLKAVCRSLKEEDKGFSSVTFSTTKDGRLECYFSKNWTQPIFVNPPTSRKKNSGAPVMASRKKNPKGKKL